MACTKSNSEQVTQPVSGETGEVRGTVVDEKGNPYPSTLITAVKGSEETSKATNTEGIYAIKTKDVGTYGIEIELPLTTELISNTPATVQVASDKVVTIDFAVEPQPIKAHLNFGNVQIVEEIVDQDGNTPTDPDEPLYAANIFDNPIGLLTAIKAPDGHHVTLSEFKKAKGNLLVHCNGESSSIEITLEGLIPNGTYSFWLAYLKRLRKVGESIDFANDFVNFNNPPVGPSNGTGNVVVADANGRIASTLEHGSCILTDEVALVIPVLYHINGKTFGGGHIPDPEETVQLLVYFQ